MNLYEFVLVGMYWRSEISEHAKTLQSDVVSDVPDSFKSTEDVW